MGESIIERLRRDFSTDGTPRRGVRPDSDEWLDGSSDHAAAESDAAAGEAESDAVAAEDAPEPVDMAAADESAEPEGEPDYSFDPEPVIEADAVEAYPDVSEELEELDEPEDVSFAEAADPAPPARKPVDPDTDLHEELASIVDAFSASLARSMTHTPLAQAGRAHTGDLRPADKASGALTDGDDHADDELPADDEHGSVTGGDDDADAFPPIMAVARRSAFAPDPEQHGTGLDPAAAYPEARAGSPLMLLPLARGQPLPGLPHTDAFDDDVGVAAVAAALAPSATKPVPRRRSHGMDGRTISVVALFCAVLGLLGVGIIGELLPASSGDDMVVAEADMSAVPSDAAAVESAEPVKDQSRVVAAAPPPEPPTDPEITGSIPDNVALRPTTAPEETRAAALETADDVETEVAEAVEPPPLIASPDAGQQNGGRLLSYAPRNPVEDPTSRSIRRPVDNSSGPAANQGAGEARTISAVNMRAAPENGSRVVAVVAAGTLVNIKGCDFWCEVSAAGKTGYIYRKFLGR